MGWGPAIFGVIAAVFGAILGTERLGRALTDDEKLHLGALLRRFDYPRVRLVALRFACKLTRDREKAQDLMGRAEERLMRLGWDPREVTLIKRLCRLVWSEWTNVISETDAARRAEEGFLREMQDSESAPSTEDTAVRFEADNEANARAMAKLEQLRAAFAKAGDEVNLLWLEYRMQGETDLKKMALACGRETTEFYRAADRRKRHTRRILAADRGEVDDEEDA